MNTSIIILSNIFTHLDDDTIIGIFRLLTIRDKLTLAAVHQHARKFFWHYFSLIIPSEGDFEDGIQTRPKLGHNFMKLVRHIYKRPGLHCSNVANPYRNNGMYDAQYHCHTKLHLLRELLPILSMTHHFRIIQFACAVGNDIMALLALRYAPGLATMLRHTVFSNATPYIERRDCIRLAVSSVRGLHLHILKILVQEVGLPLGKNTRVDDELFDALVERYDADLVNLWPSVSALIHYMLDMGAIPTAHMGDIFQMACGCGPDHDHKVPHRAAAGIQDIRDQHCVLLRDANLIDRLHRLQYREHMCNLLVEYCKIGDLQHVKLLIDYHNSVVSDITHVSVINKMLHEVVQRGHIKILEMMLKSNVFQNRVDATYKDLVAVAISANQYSIVKIIMNSVKAP